MTCDLENRVTKQQGYEPHEYEVLTESEDIGFASDMERQLQKEHGYKVDRVPYNKLKCNEMKMKINVKIVEYQNMKTLQWGLVPILTNPG